MEQAFDESAQRIIDGADAVHEICRLCRLAKKTLGMDTGSDAASE